MGNTPLDDDEREGLIPAHLQSRAELNQWEALNIAQAHQWVARRRTSDILNVDFLRELHRRMFAQTWGWAGEFRRSEKNISLHHWSQVPLLLRDLVENTRAQYNASSKEAPELDEIAARFHHGLARIPPWPNGNGRHARLAADLLMREWGRPPFTWGGADLESVGKARAAYIKALQRADDGDFRALLLFVRT